MSFGQWLPGKSCWLLISASLFGLSGGAGASWAAAALLTAWPEAVVSGASISLGDVAQIHSDDADLVARLQRVVLGQAPPPNVARHVSRSTMLMQLKHQGFVLQTLQFQGAQQVRVSRATQRLPLTALEAVVRQALSQRLHRTEPSSTIRDIRGLETVSVLPGPVDYDVLTPPRVPSAGSMAFTLAIRVAGKVERQLAGTAYVTLLRETTMREARPASDSSASHPAPAVSSGVRNGFAKQAVARPRSSDTGPVVRKGDLVQIVSESPLIKVSTPGEALESGRVGDSIRVKNTASNRAVRAQVFDKQTVRVSL